MLARATTWWTIFKICVEERLVYRGDFALGTLMRFLPIVTQIFLWTAVYASAGTGNILGYTGNDIIAYYLLTMLTRAFSSMPGLATGIARQVREGEIKKFMIQPIDLLGYLLLARAAHKVVYYLIAAGPFALVFYLCRSYFPGWPPTEIFLAFLYALLLSFFLGFFMEATMGMISFWFLEVSSLLFVLMLFTFFFSGHMFPLEFLPEFWKNLIDFTPFPYLAYFPSAVFLGKVQGDALRNGLIIETAWTIGFLVICRLSMQAGYRRYSGYGG
jgi:ABC-2 type transport system permease protein